MEQALFEKEKDEFGKFNQNILQDYKTKLKEI